MTGGPLHLGVPLAEARAVCVFVHGRGQSPEAMEEHVIRRLKAPGTAFVLPRAITGAWYRAKAVDPYTDETRGELAVSLEGLRSLIEGLPAKPLVLAGFSQGACMAIEYAMAFGRWSGALAAFTGCRVGIRSDDRPFRDLDGLPAYLSGSDKDSWIPVEAWADAAETLGKARATLTATLIPGRAHEMSAEEIAVLENMLAGFSQ